MCACACTFVCVRVCVVMCTLVQMPVEASPVGAPGAGATGSCEVSVS